jgi:hypothetical protein
MKLLIKAKRMPVHACPSEIFFVDDPGKYSYDND